MCPVRRVEFQEHLAMSYDPAQQSDSGHASPGRGLLSDIGIILAIVMVAMLGGVVSGGSADPWYAALDKPSFNPPDFLFGIVWPVLYLLMAVSAIIVRHTSVRFEWAGSSFALFFLQLGLNLAWSVLFFFFHKPAWALIDIVALWIAVALMIREFYSVSRFAGLLQLPYLAWLSFAAYLNASIVALNG